MEKENKENVRRLNILDLAKYVRAMQLYTHHAHNLVKGPLFLQDHEYLGNLYPIYEGLYDQLIERHMGLNPEDSSIDLMDIIKDVYRELKSCSCSTNENKGYLTTILGMEKKLCAMIESIIPDRVLSEGTKQLIGEICNQSEARQYILQQRLKTK